jgi:hypothetical protein
VAVIGGQTVSFEVTDGWTAEVEPTGQGLQLIRDGADLEGVSINTFNGEVFGDPCADETVTETIDATPEAYLDYLSNRGGITPTGEEQPVNIDGQQGIQLDVAVTAPEDCPASESPNYLYPVGEAGDFHMEPGEFARIIAVDPGQTLILTAEAFDDAAYVELLELLDPILDSMMITGN